MSENTPSMRFRISSAGLVAVTPVEISPVMPVEISPCVVACWDGGGVEAMPVEISPANAEKASMRVSTKAAKSR